MLKRQTVYFLCNYNIVAKFTAGPLQDRNWG